MPAREFDHRGPCTQFLQRSEDALDQGAVQGLFELGTGADADQDDLVERELGLCWEQEYFPDLTGGEAAPHELGEASSQTPIDQTRHPMGRPLVAGDARDEQLRTALIQRDEIGGGETKVHSILASAEFGNAT